MKGEILLGVDVKSDGTPRLSDATREKREALGLAVLVNAIEKIEALGLNPVLKQGRKGRILRASNVFVYRARRASENPMTELIVEGAEPKAAAPGPAA